MEFLIVDQKTWVDPTSIYVTENPKNQQLTSKWENMDMYYKGYALATDGKRFLVTSVGFHRETSFAGKVFPKVVLPLTKEYLVIFLCFMYISPKGVRN